MGYFEQLLRWPEPLFQQALSGDRRVGGAQKTMEKHCYSKMGNIQMKRKKLNKLTLMVKYLLDNNLLYILIN